MLHLINWSHLPDLDLAVKQKQGWLQWKWAGSEMAEHSQTCQSSLTHHDWKQRGKKEFVFCFSHLSLSGPPLKAWVNEICIHKHVKSQVTNLPRRKKLTSRKHKNWVKLLGEEQKLRFEFILKKIILSPSTLKKKKKTKCWKVLGSCLLLKSRKTITKELMRLDILCSQWHIWLSTELQAGWIYPLSQVSHLTVHLLLCWIAAAFEGKQTRHSFSKYKLLLKKMLALKLQRQNGPLITSIRVTLGQAAALWVEGLKVNSIL